MGEPHTMSHATPMVNRILGCDDSGYLTNTPESTDSMRTSTRLTLSSGRRSLVSEQEHKPLQESPFLASYGGMLYTPGPSFFKPVRRVALALNKPFPISAEDSRPINALAEPSYNYGFCDGDNMFVDDEPEEMCTDSEDYALENNVYRPDPLDTSLYEVVQHKRPRYNEQNAEVHKHSGMEIDEYIPQLSHPNSENEDWDEMERPYNSQILDERMSQQKRLSLDTPINQKLLLQKLQDLQTDLEESKCIKTTNWRDHLKNKGYRYAKDFSGKSTVDFMLHLGVHSNHVSVISRVLNYLSPVDLQSCTNVSKTWRNVCSQDRKSMVRLQQHTLQLATYKENNVKHTFLTQPHRNGPLTTINNFQNVRESPPSSPAKSPLKARLFEIAELEKSGVMVTLCPRCKGPAKVDKPVLEAECYKVGCQYIFCTTCRLQAHRPKSCQFATGRKAPKRGAIGSKESRKNLRRLLQT